MSAPTCPNCGAAFAASGWFNCGTRNKARTWNCYESELAQLREKVAALTKERDEALTTLWSIGLLPSQHDTLSKAAGAALGVVQHLRAELANPPPDVQELVLDKLGLRGPERVTRDQWRECALVLRGRMGCGCTETCEECQKAWDLIDNLEGGASLPPSKPLDVEKMLAACIPGGQSCDPQQVADSIRAYIEGGEG